jgi:hypothetical protein
MAATNRLVFLLGSLLACSPGIALGHGHSGANVVDCARGESIQRHIDRRNPDHALTLIIRGTCAENVTISRDDVTLVGEGGTVNGTISIVGARRVLIRTLAVSSPTGAGISGTGNAAFTVEDSSLERNATDGVTVRNGAHATLRRNRLADNGVAGLPDTGRGIHATHGGSVDAEDNTIIDNLSDGVGVYNNSYARLVRNTIERNGRAAAGDAGVQLGRSRVRAGGNIIRNNTGAAALAVGNNSDYRTGTGLNAVNFPDNEFPFDIIEHPVGPNLFAIDVNNASFGDFRQVDITGSVSAGAMSMVQVRGDDVPPNLRCSTINVPAGGSIGVNSRGLLRLRFTRVTPAIPPNPNIEVQSVCPLP